MLRPLSGPPQGSSVTGTQWSPREVPVGCLGDRSFLGFFPDSAFGRAQRHRHWRAAAVPYAREYPWSPHPNPCGPPSESRLQGRDQEAVTGGPGQASDRGGPLSK